VPAAGLSRRMGREKVLLPLGSTTILGAVLAALCRAQIAEVAVAVRADLPLAAELARRAGARVAVNPHPEGEMLSSIRIAAALLPEGLDGFLIWPADHPLVRPETLSLLLSHGGRASVLLPTHGGRRGHPAWIGADLRSDLETLDLPGGLRDLWRIRVARVREVPVEDPGVLLDVNTPEAYARAVSEWDKEAREP
jgi:molybdenum cofactor cytidylyltransferase